MKLLTGKSKPACSRASLKPKSRKTARSVPTVEFLWTKSATVRPIDFAISRQRAIFRADNGRVNEYGTGGFCYRGPRFSRLSLRADMQAVKLRSKLPAYVFSESLSLSARRFFKLNAHPRTE